MTRAALVDGEVSGLERRIALMRVAGATKDAIALLLQTDHNTVNNILKRPAVANLMLVLSAGMSDGLMDGISDLNDAIETAAHEAFHVELKNMRDLNNMGDGELEVRDVIKSKVAASEIAKDILDRAGKRAPTRTVSTQLHGQIPDSALERLESVVKELAPIDVTPNK